MFVEHLAAAIVDRHHIERELCAGVMATVCVAEDIKHKRKVRQRLDRRRPTKLVMVEGWTDLLPR